MVIQNSPVKIEDVYNDNANKSQALWLGPRDFRYASN